MLMAEYKINCRIVDTAGVILRVGVDGCKTNSVEEVYDWITAGIHNFYTYENGKRAEVKTGKSSLGKKYITTSPDGVKENNLDELTSC